MTLCQLEAKKALRTADTETLKLCVEKQAELYTTLRARKPTNTTELVQVKK